MIGYYRVSTRRQGNSGLGLAAQRAAVAAHVRQAGCDLVAEYHEVESGRRDILDNRPELRKAIAHAKRSKATLIVAKLDRLSRSVAVIAQMLADGQVKFVCCDNPNANELMIHVFAAVARDEAQKISERTRDALAAYKARGGLLGASLKRCRNLTQKARAKGAKAAGMAVRRKADEAYSDIVDDIRKMRDRGLSLMDIARELNAMGHTTRRERPWNAMQVRRVLLRSTA